MSDRIRKCVWTSNYGKHKGELCGRPIRKVDENGVPESHCCYHTRNFRNRKRKVKYPIDERPNYFRIHVRKAGKVVDIKRQFGARKSKVQAEKEIMKIRAELLANEK